MKKQIKVEVACCDFCSEQNTYHQCQLCKKDICYNCKEKFAVVYHYSVHFQGSEDVIYCQECLGKMVAGTCSKREKDIYNAYNAIKLLKDEGSRYNEDYTKRAKLVEENLKNVLNRTNLCQSE